MEATLSMRNKRSKTHATRKLSTGTPRVAFGRAGNQHLSFIVVVLTAILLALGVVAYVLSRSPAGSRRTVTPTTARASRNVTDTRPASATGTHSVVGTVREASASRLVLRIARTVNGQLIERNVVVDLLAATTIEQLGSTPTTVSIGNVAAPARERTTVDATSIRPGATVEAFADEVVDELTQFVATRIEIIS